MASTFITIVFAMLCACVSADIDGNLVFDDSPGQGRQFDGIGGLSGGGATSKLLVNYPKEQRDQILDYLFKPGFGAALQILKVEIGGDAQSTDGTEASHMHNEWEENYHRGYEWWLIGEAKKRNPKIKLVALPWTFPGWLGGGHNNPYDNITKTADYVIKWISGANATYGFTTDYVGIWNERSHNVPYIKKLRAMLDARGFQHTKIMTADCNTKKAHYYVVDDVYGDPELQKALYALGFHYPGTISLPRAKHTGLAIWASEDYSTRNDIHGGSCWARLLNQNYVNGLITSTISWNLIAAYYDTLPFSKCGLMNAEEPWSGYYEVSTPIWITAHTTQFTEPGWLYLQHGSGVGLMPKGGSHVALTDPYGTELTIVIETMTMKDSQCIRGFVPEFDSAEQTVTIELKGLYSVYTNLSVWHSKLDFTGQSTEMFMKKELLMFKDCKATLTIGINEVYTLTTIRTGQKGNFPQPPASKPFPLPYADDFEAYSLYEEPYNLAQQIGSFEVLQDTGNNGVPNKFVRQMVLQTPVMWCPAESGGKSLNVIGDANKWADILVEADVRIPTVNGSTGAYVAARVSGAGCGAQGAKGIFLYAFPTNYTLSSDLLRKNVTHAGPLSYKAGDWHKLSLFVKGDYVIGAFDGTTMFNVTAPPTHKTGYAAIGTDSFGLADFDNFQITAESEGEKIMAEYGSSTPLYFTGEKH